MLRNYKINYDRYGNYLFVLELIYFLKILKLGSDSESKFLITDSILQIISDPTGSGSITLTQT